MIWNGFLLCFLIAFKGFAVVQKGCSNSIFVSAPQMTNASAHSVIVNELDEKPNLSLICFRPPLETPLNDPY